MADDPNAKDPDIVPLRGCGPWLIGRDHAVRPNAGGYDTQFIVSAENCCSVVGPAPFEYVGQTYIGRALIVIPQLGDVLGVGEVLYFEVTPGWATCCGTPVAIGAFTMPDPVVSCVELVQIDGLMHRSLRIRASTGAGGPTLDVVSWRLAVIQCCTERRVTFGPDVEEGETPPA
jgi:hypothetical protein